MYGRTDNMCEINDHYRSDCGWAEWIKANGVRKLLLIDDGEK